MASRGVNKVTIIGNMGNDPESRNFPNGDVVTNITVATSEKWKDKTTGEDRERTEWHRIVFHRRLAEVAAQYLRKGSKVYIEGRLQTRKWQDKATGADRYATEIVANDMQMLDGKAATDAQPINHHAPQQRQPAVQQAPMQQHSAQHQPQQMQPVQHQPAPQQAVQQAPQQYSDPNDIPF